MVALSSLERPAPHLESHTSEPHGIKVLDPLTRRYYAGVVQHASDGSLQIELNAARLSPGQRVGFSIADHTAPLISRRTMRTALVTEVFRVGISRLRVALSLVPDSLAA